MRASLCIFAATFVLTACAAPQTPPLPPASTPVQNSTTPAVVPTRTLSPAWAEGDLYGNSNDVARLGRVTIDGDARNGYRVRIESQSTINCGLGVDGNGDPNELINCTDSERWTILTPTIPLRCQTRETEVVCRGQYTMRPPGPQEPEYNQTWNMTIARRL